jgi:endonuclease/exonuclease/phosphatase (EEP) superfamily protein YafD
VGIVDEAPVTRRRRGFLQATILLALAAWTAVRLLGVEQGYPAIQLMAFTPYVAVGSLVPLVLALLTRRWWHAGLAGVLVIVLAVCVLPRLVPGGAERAADGPHLRVLTANLYVGAADPGAVMTLARARRVDVLAFQELTPRIAAALDAAGLATSFPYRASYPQEGAGGSGLFSRLPLQDAGVRRLPGCHQQAFATVRVPGTAPTVPATVLESAHPCAPSDDARTRAWAQDVAAQPAATPSGDLRVLLGDFNATLDHGGLRALIATGYRDAAATLGAGLDPTWPYRDGAVGGLPVPPVTLDHVLADRRIAVAQVAIEPVAGSDHRAVIAELVLPAR